MRFSIRYADKIVGTLIILAIVILVAVLFMLGINQRWFTSDYEYKTYFSSASGLSTNMAVQYKGFTIGNVKKFRLSEDDSVEVVFSIFEEYVDKIKVGSVVEIQVSPIGLGSSFIFYPGRGEELLPEGSIIPEANSPEGVFLKDLGLVDRPESTGDSIINIVNQVRSILDTVDIALSGSYGAEEITLWQILRNIEVLTESLAVQVSPIMANLEIVTGQLSEPSGTVMSFLDSEGPIYSEVINSLNSLSSVIENLNSISEFIPSQLPQVAVGINDLTVALRSAQDLLTAVSNNPLLRSGIPQRTETGPGGAGNRNLEF
jgi:phospholipid/cholesterol/gamma-HCH transport system substrate-binding protein